MQFALIKAVSELLKIKPEDFDSDSELSELGFDSITVTEFTNKLNEEYKLELVPTLFFEYPTIHKFADYLTEEYQPIFSARFSVQPKVMTSAPSVGKKYEETHLLKSSSHGLKNGIHYRHSNRNNLRRNQLRLSG